MTIPEIYEKAARLVPAPIAALGTAHPTYQDELRRIADQLKRDAAREEQR